MPHCGTNRDERDGDTFPTEGDGVLSTRVTSFLIRLGRINNMVALSFITPVPSVRTFYSIFHAMSFGKELKNERGELG